MASDENQNFERENVDLTDGGGDDGAITRSLMESKGKEKANGEDSTPIDPVLQSESEIHASNSSALPLTLDQTSPQSSSVEIHTSTSSALPLTLDQTSPQSSSVEIHASTSSALSLTLDQTSPQSSSVESSTDSTNGTAPIFVYFVDKKFNSEINGLLSSDRLHINNNTIYSTRSLKEGQYMVPIGENETEGAKGFYEANIKFAYEIEMSKLNWNPAKPLILPLSLEGFTVTFPRVLPVVEYLIMNVAGFESLHDVNKFKSAVEDALTGLKVRVTHRNTDKEFTIAGLAGEDACESTFDDRHGEKVELVHHFLDHWKKTVKYVNTPCLELGSVPSRSNKVPMEFCELVKGKYRREERSVDTTGRRRSYYQAESNQGTVEAKMTKLTGRVVGDLKQNDPIPIFGNLDNVQWELLEKTLVDALPLQHWALIDFTSNNELSVDKFVKRLTARCEYLGLKVSSPLVTHRTGMKRFRSLEMLERTLKDVIEDFLCKRKGRPQMIVCLTTEMRHGYMLLKWLCETKFGVLTQCFSLADANKGCWQYYASVCLKINAKLGGNNFKVNGNFGPPEEPVMFIGVANPDHEECPSIAAVAASVDWPATDRYAARFMPQVMRRERISGFGGMCRELVQVFEKVNGKKPSRIVLFRAGGCAARVVEKEVAELKHSIFSKDYQPGITAVVAQKRRVWVGNGEVVEKSNTNAETEADILCVCLGGVGKSKAKAVEYRVVIDENELRGEKLLKMVYEMCCNNPNQGYSVVPAVQNAELAVKRGHAYREVLRGVAAASVTDPALYEVHYELKNLMFFV